MRWNLRRVLAAICLFFGVWVLLQFLWAARLGIITILLGVLVGITLARGVDELEQRRIPRAAGAPLLMLLVVLIIAATAWILEPSVAAQVVQIRNRLPAALDKLETSVNQQIWPNRPGELQRRVAVQTKNLSRMLFPFLANSFAAIAALAVIVFLSMYVAVQSRKYRAGLIHLIPPRARPKAVPVLDELGNLMQKWLTARVLAMFVVGTLKGIGLWALGIPAPIALGVIAGLTDFIPFFGPIFAGALAAAVGLLISPTKALEVIALTVVVQQAEGHLIIPLIMRGRLDVPPLISIVMITCLGIVLGLPGMLIGEPLSAAAIFLVRHLYVNPI
ncbi:MAG TPA: AI-2E family transporter, partial [Thermoanaerobaculia bacterium]